MNKENVELTKRLRDFFQIYLPKQKCYSENTVTSYKYAFNLFFDFLNCRKGIGMTKITMDCFSGESVSEFMEWLSRERNNSASTLIFILFCNAAYSFTYLISIFKGNFYYFI